MELTATTRQKINELIVSGVWNGVGGGGRGLPFHTPKFKPINAEFWRINVLWGWVGKWVVPGPWGWVGEWVVPDPYADRREKTKKNARLLDGKW